MIQVSCLQRLIEAVDLLFHFVKILYHHCDSNQCTFIFSSQSFNFFTDQMIAEHQQKSLQCSYWILVMYWFLFYSSDNNGTTTCIISFRWASIVFKAVGVSSFTEIPISTYKYRKDNHLMLQLHTTRWCRIVLGEAGPHQCFILFGFVLMAGQFFSLE